MDTVNTSVVIRIKLTPEQVKSREDWIEFVTEYPDIFGYGYIGYWGRGVRIPEVGWKVDIMDPDHDTGKSFTINARFAARVFDLMAGREGINWYAQGDANTYDRAIQYAAFGRLVYG